MKYHLDYGLRLQDKPQYKALYEWAINEVEADGSQLNRDQIPWDWTLYFSATSCTLTNYFEIVPWALSSKLKRDEPPEITTGQIITIVLRPGIQENGKFVRNATYSMFGTKRQIQHFVLQVYPLDSSANEELCEAE